MSNLCRDCAHWSPAEHSHLAPWHTCTNKKLLVASMCGCGSFATAPVFGCVLFEAKGEEGKVVANG